MPHLRPDGVTYQRTKSTMKSPRDRWGQLVITFQYNAAGHACYPRLKSFNCTINFRDRPSAYQTRRTSVTNLNHISGNSRLGACLSACINSSLDRKTNSIARADGDRAGTRSCLGLCSARCTSLTKQYKRSSQTIYGCGSQCIPPYRNINSKGIAKPQDAGPTLGRTSPKK